MPHPVGVVPGLFDHLDVGVGPRSDFVEATEAGVARPPEQLLLEFVAIVVGRSDSQYPHQQWQCEALRPAAFRR